MVNAPDAGGGVADVDEGVPGGVGGGQRGAGGDGFAGADLAGDDAEGFLPDGPGPVPRPDASGIDSGEELVYELLAPRAQTGGLYTTS
jgi:hypothetical protein